MDRQRAFDSEHPRAIHPDAVRLRSRGRARTAAKANHARGFTVLEVFVVVATVSTLTAIAVPSYVHQLRKSARVEAQSFLEGAAAKEREHFLERGRYTGNLHALGMLPPAQLTGKYTFVVKTAGGAQPAFTLSAIATGEQARDACPTLTIHSSGSRLPDACW